MKENYRIREKNYNSGHTFCKSLFEICKPVKRSRFTIQGIIDGYSDWKFVKILSRNECPMKLNDCTKRVISRKAKKSPRISIAKIRSKLGTDWKLIACASTIKKRLYSNGYHCRSARRKPLINSVNNMNRLLYAISYKNASLHSRNKEIFTDEMKLTIF